MAAATKASAHAAVETVPPIPFNIRLKAWWEGRNPTYVYRDHLAANPPAAPAAAKSKAAAAAPAPEPEPEEEGTWPPSLLSFYEKAWGAGFLEPGGEDWAKYLVKPLALNPALTVLELGSRLGGSTRAVAQEFGVWMSGLEPDPELAATAMALSTKAGLQSRAPIESCDLSDLEVPPSKYDAIFAKEAFHRVRVKGDLLERLVHGLKEQGQLLFTDFVLRQDGIDSDALTRWTETEREHPYPMSIQTVRDALSGQNMDVRIAKDTTEEYKTNLLSGWNDLTNRVKSLNLTAREQEHMFHEGEVMAMRVAALDSGDLRVYRFHAIRKAIRLMSE
jgi:cyclopropane fatty-acyl-phospholipid synthase-like methyltransferase